MTTTYFNDMPKAKLTQHQDYSVSLRLRRHSDGTDKPSMDMVLHGLRQAANSFLGMAFRIEEGRLSNGERPSDAADYRRMAQQYELLADQVAAAIRG